MMDIASAVRESLKSIQTRSGRVWKELADDEPPIGSLDGFDSYAAVEATSELEDLLGCQLELTIAFVNGNKVLTMHEVCAQVEAALREPIVNR